MKGYLYSQDGSYAFPLGPKVTTIGRENCDISINSTNVDNQHALLEYDNEQRCFILKDLNSSTGTYVHECRVQNAAVRLADGDFIRFGFNGLPLEFRVDQQQETTMPPIYQRHQTSNSLHLISQTLPARRSTSSTNQYPQQIDAQQNPSFSLRTRPSSAGTKKVPGIMATPNQNSNGIRDSVVRHNAWTITTTSDPNKSIINGSFSGELDIAGQDNTEIINRVDQLEKEVKGRGGEIRELTNKIRTLEPLSTAFTQDVHTLKTELDKVKREKNAASGLISSLQRDLHSKESDLAKLSREIEGIKTDSRDKDVRLQTLQSKFNLLRDRTRAEADRANKERELKLQSAEKLINELNESINRLKSQLQDTEKQLLKVTQNEQKLKQEYEQTREQLAEIQRSETTLKSDLADTQRKHNQSCTDIWRCFSDDEYNEDQHDIIEQIQQLRQQLEQSRNELDNQRNTQSSSNEQFKVSFGKLIDIFTNTTQEQITEDVLLSARQEITEFEGTDNDDDSPIGMFKKAAINAIDNHAKLISGMNNLLAQQNDHEQNLSSIRSQYEELEREKENFSLEQTSREETFRSELEQANAEKDAFWQQRLNEECDRLREQMTQLQKEFDEQSHSSSDQLEKVTAENSEYLQKWNDLQTESTQKIDELTTKLQEYEQQLTEIKEQQNEVTDINERQREELSQLEKEKNETIEDLNSQIQVYKDQVRQFSITIVQLEKDLGEEQEKRIKVQTDFDNQNKNANSPSTSPPPPPPVTETIVPVVPVLTAPFADLSHELFAYKSRVQEQEQIIISLRRDLVGMTARLSDVQGELSEKQKQTLEKSEVTIREQNKELNETRLKLSKLSDIVDKQTSQIQTLQTDLSKAKVLVDQYQLLVDQRQTDIDRLTKTLEQNNIVVQQVERTNQDEGRITHELVAIGAQCKGERHELTIGRQREALNELRARIKSLEQLRPVNPSYEKVLQQVVILKRELAELRARQALPTDIPYLTATTPGANSIHQQSQRHSSATNQSEHVLETQKVVEERAAHAETINSLQSCDDLHNSFARRLIQLLDIDDDSLSNIAPLASLPTTDRYVALQQRQRTTEILVQKIEMLRERLTRKEELLRDYEKDLGKLRQAEILLREKNGLLQDLEMDKRTKDDEALFLRNTLRETQDNLNQEKRLNSSVKLGRNIDQVQPPELIRRSGGSTVTLHHHCPPDTSGKFRTVKRDMNQKIARKDYEIKTLKHELHEALDTLSDQSHKVRQLELQSKDDNNGTNIYTSSNS
ncbi:unnamed protein product [Adineta steineri]|uniref:FHA domain-containing protein n=1 Tax=Adineta steineri TaxID=433720 RepID=A0A813VKX2_9BILA|nr:unnamed protein product [Adineta steineri]CAF0874043.1 unnamed protein product [Adineta steineri]CAF3513886.1 unnamed protein product [Adineta steineri]CAF3745476.1 unnamed protein product [Adineta steineri]